MSTDRPSGALHYDAEMWDADRVRHVEDEWKQAGQGLARGGGAAQGQRRTRRVFGAADTPRQSPGWRSQDDTLVAKPHRGHRLGMLVKLLNLRRLMQEHPAVERVLTFNAAENDHMLAINVALGFRPAGYDGEWQRRC